VMFYLYEQRLRSAEQRLESARALGDRVDSAWRAENRGTEWLPPAKYVANLGWQAEQEASRFFTDPAMPRVPELIEQRITDGAA
jgi:hypothetical protein